MRITMRNQSFVGARVTEGGEEREEGQEREKAQKENNEKDPLD